MKMISASDFKSRCLALMDDIGPDGVIITKRGKPVARLLPIEQSSGHLIGKLKGRLKITGDIMSAGVKWDAESGHSYLPEKPDRRTHRRRSRAAE